MLSLIGGNAHGQNLIALFNPAASQQQAGTIDPTTGTESTIGSSIAGGGINGGSAYDATNNLLYYRGSVGPALQVIDVSDGTSMSVTDASLSGVIEGLEIDVAEDVLYSLWAVSGDRQLGSINPASGVVTLTADIDGIGLSTTGINTQLDAAGNRFFFIGTPSGGSLSIYVINTATGAASSVQALSGGVTISNIIYHSNGTLYGLVSTAGARQLATIDVTDGTVSTIGSAFDGGASISTSADKIAINEAGNELYFQGNGNNIYTVNLTTGTATSQSTSTNTFSLEFDGGSLPVSLLEYSIQ